MRRFEKYKGSYQTLRYCDVSNNAIQMNVTARLANIPPNIEQLFAQNNQIYGSLPESSEYLLRLLHLSMSNNYISGSLPESLNHLPWILTFNISSNALSGQIPHFTESFVSLQEIDMSNQTNGFTGSIPKRIGFFQSLKILKLAGNKITGTVPSSIGYMAALEVLDLSTNRFKNSIPSELGKLGGVLNRLDLSNNNLSGVIPSAIDQLQGADILLEGNDFDLPVPLSLCILRSVEVFDLANDTTLCPLERNALSDFYDSAKGEEWTYRTNWKDEYVSLCNWYGVTCDINTNQVTKLELRNNGLSGRLSESIGNLTSMEVLDLSDNDMKGSIPTEIGLLSNLTYLRLSYNAFTGTAPKSLKNVTNLQLLQLQSNRFTEIPNTTKVDLSKYNQSAFVADCGVPFVFEDALLCEHCTMCCNANEDCHPQEDTIVQKLFNLSYGDFAAVLIPCFVALCYVVVRFLYFFHKRRNRGEVLTLTMSTEERRIEEDEKYALGRIGKDSVYSYFVTETRIGCFVAFTTLGMQFAILIFFVIASEVNFQDDNIDIQFTVKCPRDSDECRETADLNEYGWVIFSTLMIANLAKDSINGSKLMYHSSRIRHSLCSRIRYFIGGVGLCSITLFALYVSIIYNKAIATSNTDIIVNSVIVLFVMDLDEWIFNLLEACNKNWTAHASGVEAEKEGAVKEMKEEMALQKTQIQIADQQEELEMLRSQQEKSALEMEEKIAMLRETVEKLLESQEAAAAASSGIITQCAAENSLITHTAKLEYVSSDVVAGEGDNMDAMEDVTSPQEGQIIASQLGVAMPGDEEQGKEESRVGAAASTVTSSAGD